MPTDAFLFAPENLQIKKNSSICAETQLVQWWSLKNHCLILSCESRSHNHIQTHKHWYHTSSWTFMLKHTINWQTHTPVRDRTLLVLKHNNPKQRQWKKSRHIRTHKHTLTQTHNHRLTHTPLILLLLEPSVMSNAIIRLLTVKREEKKSSKGTRNLLKTQYSVCN